MVMRVLLGLGLLLVVALGWWHRPEVSRAACPELVTTQKIAFDRRLLQRTVDGVVVALPAELTKVRNTNYPFSSKCWVHTYFPVGQFPGNLTDRDPITVVCEYAGDDDLAIHLLGGDSLPAHGGGCVHALTIQWHSQLVAAPTSHEVYREIAKRTD